MSGKFIVLEGGEGSGKDANIAYLQAHLPRDTLVYTREPGGTQIGEAIRGVLMDQSHTSMCVETELLLFLASRAQLLEEVVRPALCGGRHVLSNRFGLSTIAYQIYRKERYQYRAFLDEVSERLVGDVTPYYILLDVDPEVGLARARGRDEAATRFDNEDVAVHTKVRRGYLDAVQGFEHTIIDANKPLAEVQTAVLEAVTKVLKI